jgi:CPA2 family monovalent cation:H+ antiporter-2
MLHSPIFLELLILFGAATAVTTLCHYLQLPTIIGFIVTGLLVGPSGMGLVSSLPNADNLAEIAGIFLMFTIGLEFSFKRLLKLRREFVRLGFLQVGLTTVCVAWVLHLVMDFPWSKGVFGGFLVALSSTALVMKLLQDARELETPYGMSSLSILLFQDIAVIPMMLALPLLALSPGAASSVSATPLISVGSIKTIALIVGTMGAIWLSTRYIIPHLLERIVATRSREVFFFFVLFFCLGVAYLFQWGGLSLSLGAFAAGLIVSESPYGRQVTSDILPLRDNFLGIFFASVGMLLDLSFVAKNWNIVLFLGATGFLIKVAVISLVGRLYRLPWSLATIMGLVLCQVGEFSFILASRGQELGLLEKQEYQFFLSITVLSMAATPFLYKLAPLIIKRSGPLSWRTLSGSKVGDKVRKAVAESQATDQRSIGSGQHTISQTPHSKMDTPGQALIIGFGISGENVAAAFESLKIPFRVIELNHQTFKRARRHGIDIHYGDATRPDVLDHNGLGSARLVVVTVSGSKVLPLILTAIRHHRPDVQVIIRAQYVRDVEALAKEPQTEIVVGEIETSIEILARALTVYGVSSRDIRRYMEEARSALHNLSQIKASLQSSAISLPSWDALGMIKPLRIDQDFAAVDRVLGDLDVRRKTGAMVVAVFREGLGSTVPDPEFSFKAGDVVQLVGSAEAQEQAETLFRTGASGF